MVVESDTPAINAERRALVQMLFVEGNHFCPSCEKSGDCKLQATAYDLGMMSPHFDHFFPDRPVDASHPELLLDFNRCILCSLCVRASRDVDRKNVFALVGPRHPHAAHRERAQSGRLADTDIAATDKAVHVCPVGVILRKRRGFARADRAAGVRPEADLRRAPTRRPRSPPRTRRDDGMDGPAHRKLQGRHDVARRLLRLPHVAPRHRRAPLRRCSS